MTKAELLHIFELTLPNKFKLPSPNIFKYLSPNIIKLPPPNNCNNNNLAIYRVALYSTYQYFLTNSTHFHFEMVSCRLILILLYKNLLDRSEILKKTVISDVLTTKTSSYIAAVFYFFF